MIPGMVEIVPRDWKEKTLGELCSLRRELVEPSSTGAQRYVGLEHIDPGVFRLRRWGDERGLRSTKSRFHVGDVLYGKLRPYLDKAVLAEWEGVCSTDILTIQPRPDVADSSYLAFLAHTPAFIAHAVATTSGVNHPRTGWSEIARFSHQIPPLAEQRAIAGVLGKIQAAVEVQEKIVATLKELKAATMAKLFREGLRGEPLKQTEIGEIPESWQVVQLDDYCEKPRYGFTESAKNEPVGPKFLRITDITEYGVDWDAVPYCACPQEVLDEFRLRAGDLVVARIGATTGKSYLITECPEAVFASYLIRLRAKPGLDSAYLSCFFETEAYWSQVRAGKGSNLKGGMNASILSKLLIPLPSYDEQKQIVATLKGIDRQITTVLKMENVFKSIFSSMLHLLMTGRVRVTRKMIALQALEDRMRQRPKWSGKVDEEVLEEIVRRIVEAVAPEKIILFGSAARGEMEPDSDIDLLVIKECDHPRELARLIRRRLADIEIPKDILVVRPATLEKHRETIGYIYRPALREGKVIYAP